MAASPYEIIAGPATVYIAAVATAFPVVNVAPGAGWTSLGRTEGGVTVRHRQNIEAISSDQDLGTVKAIRTDEGLELAFSLMDVTLENLAFALSKTVTSAAGPPATKSMTVQRGPDVAQNAMLVRGPSPYGNFSIQWEVPVVYQSDEPELQFVKDDNAVIGTTWVALADPTAVFPNKYGRVIAQSA